jgi:uncharacterized integral membrane protein
MLTRTSVIVAMLALLAIFVMLNWTAFSTPTVLSLGFWQVTAPLGLIMLGVTALLGTLFLAFALYLQGVSLMEARRLGRELEAQRQVADKAEASRFTQLQSQVDEARRAMLERLDKLDRDFGTALERTESAMAAYVGELDDRLERTFPQRQA